MGFFETVNRPLPRVPSYGCNSLATVLAGWSDGEISYTAGEEIGRSDQ